MSNDTSEDNDTTETKVYSLYVISFTLTNRKTKDNTAFKVETNVHFDNILSLFGICLIVKMLWF